MHAYAMLLSSLSRPKKYSSHLVTFTLCRISKTNATPPVVRTCSRLLGRASLLPLFPICFITPSTSGLPQALTLSRISLFCRADLHSRN